MSHPQTEIASGRSWFAGSAINPYAAIGCLTLAFGVWLRFLYRDGLPLWLDETFTGAIASEPTLAAVMRQTLLDVNAPGYYVIAHVWSTLTSFSNEALRTPALCFGLAAPLVCLVETPGITPRARWIWLMLTALWLPAVIYSNEARGYSLLYALAIANTLAFARFYTRLMLRDATLWTVSAAALLLTHYVAIFLVAAQGAVALAILRRRALRLWPAVLPLVPVLALMGYHSARVSEFADREIAWYPLVDIGLVPHILIWTIGGIPTAIWILLTTGALLHRSKSSAAPVMRAAGPEAAFAAGAAAWTAFVILCMFRPNFTARYLITFAPALLLGVALYADRSAVLHRYAPLTLVPMIFIQPLAYLRADRSQINAFQFQSGSQFLMDAGARKVTLLWDNPTNQAEAPEQMDRVAGFFFRRAGSDVLARSIRLPRGADPNNDLPIAASAPGDGFIWVYDRNVHHTAAILFPPRLDEALFGFQCRSVGDEMSSVLACIRRKPA